VSRSASRVSTPAPNVLRQEIDLSPSQPSADSSGGESLTFWEHVGDVPENLWCREAGEKGYRVYLYDQDSPGSKYLAVIFHPFDIEWIKQNYGGGRYRAQLNDSSGRIVSKEIFAIDGESKRKPPQNAQNSTAPAPADSFQAQMLEIMREGQRRQEELIRQLMERQTNPAPAAPAAIDPNVALRGVVEIFSGLVARAATPQPQMDLVQMFALVDRFKGPDLITQMKAMREAGLIPAVATAGGSLVTQFKELKEAAEVVGLGQDKGKNWVETLIDKGPQIIEAGSTIVDKLQSVEHTRLQTARTVHAIQQQQRGAVVTPPPQPNGAPHPPAPQQQQIIPPAPNAPGLEVETPGSPAAEQAIAEAESKLKFIKEKVVELIAQGKSGGEIIDFLDNLDKSICDGFAGASVEQIIAVFSNDSHLRKATALPRFKAAIVEMVEELNGPDDQLERPQRPN
jgi:hypothetical protein